MNKTIDCFAVIFTFILPFVCLGQTLPELTPTNSKIFSIPFEIRLNGSADPVKEVELLVSKDNGSRWSIAGKQPVAAKRFEFKADAEGEYWFTFRTVTLSGIVNPSDGRPQLRVLVDVHAAVNADPVQAKSDAKTETKGESSGPVTPPKPVRMRQDNKQDNPQKPLSEAISTAKPGQMKLRQTKPGQPTQNFPAFPDWELPPEIISNEKEEKTDDLLESFLSNMSPYFDIEPVPVAVKAAVNKPVATDKSVRPAGTIAGITLNPTASRPQIIVKWNVGDPTWQDAQIDILRSFSKEGPWNPVVINLPNNGEYWWFLTQEDLKPFYLAVRIRSIYGGIQLDAVPSPITIPKQ